MKEMTYHRIGETAVWQTLPNGLPVCVIRKRGYTRKYAFFATRYGGMDLRFQLDGQWLDTPAGIAHYLEHKMFDTEDGNALQELPKTVPSPMPSPPTPSPDTILTPPSILKRICASFYLLCPSPISPMRVWKRSRASSARRSA